MIAVRTWRPTRIFRSLGMTMKYTPEQHLKAARAIRRQAKGQPDPLKKDRLEMAANCHQATAKLARLSARSLSKAALSKASLSAGRSRLRKVDFDAAFDAGLDDTFGAKQPQREEFRRPAEKPEAAPEAETDPSFLTGMSPETRRVWDAADRQADKDIAVQLGRRIDKMRKAGNAARANELEAKLDGILQAIGVREHDRNAAFSAGATESRPRASGPVRGFTAEEMAEIVKRGRARGKTYAGFDEPREAPKAEPERRATPSPTPPRTSARAWRRRGRAAKHAGAGLKDVLKGLNELFGGGAKFSSGLTFDDETYAKAKPFFISGAKHFVEAGRGLGETVKLLVRWLAQNGMDREAVERMRPYVRRFMEDFENGAVNLE